ncbi:hypothetical protein ACJJU9_04060 [Pseudomonas helleri]|uniref:hypothetical protein n=1 Tax=Pseudomonas helleri TaxID=1608996 RepID=UPI0033408881
MTSKTKAQKPTLIHPRKSTQGLPAPTTPDLPNNTLSIGSGQGEFEVDLKTHLYKDDYLTFYFQTYDAKGNKGSLWYLGHGIQTDTENTFFKVVSEVFKPVIGGTVVISYSVAGTAGPSAEHTITVVA